MSADEAALVRHCLRGNPAAVRRLVDCFHGPVFGLCMRLLGHRQDAEDVTQEAFLRIFRGLRRWDPARPLRPWILGIAANRCRSWGASRARRPQPVPYVDDAAVAPQAEDTAELLAEIAAAVRLLRPGFREAFVLFHEHGHSYDQIASALGRPVGTVKTWLHRARLEMLHRLRRRGMVPEVTHGLP